MDFKKTIPHAIALVIMLAISMLYFAPNAFRGKVLPQPDNEKAFGMRTEIVKYLDEGKENPRWTNSAFGGMPSYQIYSTVDGNFSLKLSKALILFQSYSDYWAFFFCGMLCMYLFLLALKIDWRIALFGALVSVITSYNADIVEAGHSTKMYALALAPGIFAGVAWLIRGQYVLGGGILALFAGIQIAINHVQITYYTFMMIGIYFIIAGVYAAMRKTFQSWLIAIGVTAAATALAVGTNAAALWSTWEYGKETIRGKSELTQSGDKGDGLSKDYLFGWSYGIGESFTLLVPHYAGGGAGETFASTNFHKRLFPNIVGQMTQSGTPAAVAKEQADKQISTLFYTGDQPFVGTAIYFGAILIFLALCGMMLGSNEEKWWLVAGGVFMLSIAWGKNFGLNNLWYDIMPLFKKFRAVSMALGLSQLFFAALAAMGLQELMDGDHALSKRKRALYMSAGITLLLLLLAMATAPSVGPNDSALGDQKALVDLLKADRSSLVKSDVMRSLLFVAATFGLLFFYLHGRLKGMYAVAVIAVLALVDQWGVASRTLSADKYINKPKTTYSKPDPTPADLRIMEDKDIHYRVLDLSRGSITGNANTSFYHKSISGYHAAKIQIFQEVVDKYLGADLGKNLHIIGMLNGKYLIGQDGQVMPNDKNCGDAWFVSEVQTVANADEEINALGALDPKNKAVVQSRFENDINGWAPRDSTDKIELTGYHPDKMEYTYTASGERFAVFSEIFYSPEKGWKTYLNGQPYQDFIKTNYLVRGLKLPKGQDMKLEMRFEPQSIAQGESISMIASILSILLFATGLFFFFKKHPINALESIDEVVREEKTIRVEKPVVKPSKPTKR
jgi:hypothetical protein